MRRRALALVVLLAGACSQADDTTAPAATTTVVTTSTVAPDGTAWPVPEWTVVDAATAGLDAGVLDELAAQAEAGGSTCFVVTRDGRVVAEHYWYGATETSAQEAFSVTKSIASTLVGIAQDRGLLDIDQPVADFVTEWQGTASETVTIRHLLSMDSGRRQDFQTDYVAMARDAADKTAFSIDLDQQHPPGASWAYNNAGVQVLERVIEVATGKDAGAFAEEALFAPLGMTSTMRRDAAGNTLLFMGMQASCRDLARFGLLFLRQGEWRGRQVVSREWVAEATAPSQELNDGYGFLWWLHGDHYVAHGLWDQLVVVQPDTGFVVTRMGGNGGPTAATFSLTDVQRGMRNAVRVG